MRGSNILPVLLVAVLPLACSDPGADMTGEPGGDFPRESFCVGLGRANLTGGNLTVHVPTID